MCSDKAVSWSRILLLGLTLVEQISLLRPVAGQWVRLAGSKVSMGVGNWGGSSSSLRMLGEHHRISREDLKGSCAAEAPERHTAFSHSHRPLEPRSWDFLIWFPSRYEFKVITEHRFGLLTVFPLSSCPSETDLSIWLESLRGWREADEELYSVVTVMTTDGPHMYEAFITAFILCKATCFSWVPQAFVHWSKNQSIKTVNLITFHLTSNSKKFAPF